MSKWLKVLSISSVVALLIAAAVGVALAQGPDDGNNPPTATDDGNGEQVYSCHGAHGYHDGRGPHSDECDCQGDGNMYGLRGDHGPHSDEYDCQGDGNMYGLRGDHGPHSDECDCQGNHLHHTYGQRRGGARRPMTGYNGQ